MPPNWTTLLDTTLIERGWSLMIGRLFCYRTPGGPTASVGSLVVWVQEFQSLLPTYWGQVLGLVLANWWAEPGPGVWQQGSGFPGLVSDYGKGGSS